MPPTSTAVVAPSRRLPRKATADAQVRSVVSEGGSAGLDYNEAQRHSDAMARHRSDLVDTIARLEATQDELLDQLVAKRSGS